MEVRKVFSTFVDINSSLAIDLAAWLTLISSEWISNVISEFTLLYLHNAKLHMSEGNYGVI